MRIPTVFAINESWLVVDSQMRSCVVHVHGANLMHTRCRGKVDRDGRRFAAFSRQLLRVGNFHCAV